MANQPEESLSQYAAWLTGVMRDSLQVQLQPGFQQSFVRQARRVGEANYQDLGSWVLLECLEERATGKTLDEKQVLLAIDRVRKRITRQARRLGPQLVADQIPDNERLIPQNAAHIVNEFQDVLAGLSPLHLLLFETLFLDKKNVKQAAKELGLSPATIYRRVDEIKKAFAQFREGP